MSIKGLSEQRRMPRLGKLHLGIKVTTVKDGKEITYPKAVDYFVCPPEVQAIFGEQPKALDIMFPVEDPEKFAPQNYKCYSSFRGLVCKGNGETCMRMIDTATGDFAHRDTKEVAMAEAKCDGQDCPQYQAKKCKEVMNLQFLLPTVPGLGVWQLDTGSYHGIVTVNSALDLIKNVCGRVSMIPLKLTVEPKEVTVDGKKKKVHVLNVRANVTLAEIQRVAALPCCQVMLPPPDEERPELITGTLEEPMSDKEADALFDKKPPPLVVKPADKPPVAKPAEQVAQVVSTAAPKQEAAPTGKAHHDIAAITTLGGLFTACFEDFNMSRSDIAKEAGYKSIEDLRGKKPKEYQDIYQAIAAVRG